MVYILSLIMEAQLAISCWAFFLSFDAGLEIAPDTGAFAT